MRVLEMVVEAAEVCTFNAASSTSNPPCHEGENQDCRGHTYCPHREGEEKPRRRPFNSDRTPTLRRTRFTKTTIRGRRWSGVEFRTCDLYCPK